MARLQIDAVSKRFGAEYAMREVSLDLRSAPMPRFDDKPAVPPIPVRACTFCPATRPSSVRPGS
ncbi:hypothetical protein ACFXG4_37405 [Nocardia sp. NPDC059246]|uniref:hypothetical protein n=1 Tax=unclassified Nocardia TaxID=2637762 RepID=UPI0036CAB0C3